MTKKPVITIIGFPAIKADKRADIRTFNYSYPSLLGMKSVPQCPLILLDMRRGFPEWPIKFPKSNGHEDSLQAECEELSKSFTDAEKLARILGIDPQLASLFPSTGCKDIGVFFRNLISRSFGPPRAPRPFNGFFRPEPVFDVWDFLRAELDVPKLLERHYFAPIKRVYGFVWQRIAEGALAVLLLPTLAEKKEAPHLDDILVEVLYRFVLTPFRVRACERLKAMPTAVCGRLPNRAVNRLLLGHTVFLGEAPTEIAFCPTNGFTSGSLTAQDICNRLPLDVMTHCTPASTAKDGLARSLLIQCGGGTAVILGESADAKGLAEYAVSCILDPESGPFVSDKHVIVSERIKVPLVFTLVPCIIPPSYNGFIVRLNDEKIKLAMKGYLTLLAFAVASEHPTKKSIDLSAPKIGGSEGTKIGNLIYRSTVKTAKIKVRRLNEYLGVDKDHPVIVLAEAKGQGARTYRLNTSMYEPDFSELGSCDNDAVRRLLSLRSKAI